MSRIALERLGKLLIQEVADEPFKDICFTLSSETKAAVTQEFQVFLLSLNASQQAAFITFLHRLQRNTVFNLLRIFEEHPEFQITVQNEFGESIDALKLSDSLMAEPVIDCGWIEQFSKYQKGDFQLPTPRSIESDSSS